MEEAGFRMDFTSIYWTYTTGLVGCKRRSKNPSVRSAEMTSRISFNLCLAKRSLRLEAKRERLLLPVVVGDESSEAGTYNRGDLPTISQG